MDLRSINLNTCTETLRHTKSGILTSQNRDIIAITLARGRDSTSEYYRAEIEKMNTKRLAIPQGFTQGKIEATVYIII